MLRRKLEWAVVDLVMNPQQTRTFDGSAGWGSSKWNRPVWGNFSSNLQFLEATGVLRSPLRILDIGCGKGLLAEHLRAHGHHVVGVDASLQAISACSDTVMRCVALGQALPLAAKSFDLVVEFDVFEHIPDTDEHLSEVHRVLAPGGCYLFQTPNKWTNVPFEMLRWARVHGIRHTFDFLRPPAHCALHNYWQLRRRLASHEFSATFYDIKVVNDYFRSKVAHFAGSAGLVVLKWLNPDRFPMPLRTNFYVEARPLR